MTKTLKKRTALERFESIRYSAVKLLRPPRATSAVKLAYLDITEEDAIYLKRVYSKPKLQNFVI
jgi:hypothetical protein